MDWKTLDSLEFLQEAIESSQQHPVVLFKHSTRCSISRLAKKLTEQQWDLPNEVHPYLLDLLNHRDVSEAIANQFQIHHESPQFLLIKNKTCVFHANHHHIDPIAAKAYL
ncbi:MAG: bacillithiol system redox-active protein YtxJ [Flavobacteriales bacterium]